MDYLQPHRQLQAEGQVNHGSLTGIEEQGKGASEVNFFMVMRRDVLPMYNKVWFCCSENDRESRSALRKRKFTALGHLQIPAYL